jgi:hypothetical protein
MRILVGICVATLALGACQKAAETAEVAAPEKGPVPPGLDAAPLLKAGLWELTPEGVPMRAQSCIDEATQADSAALGQNLDRRYCTRSVWVPIPGGMAFEFDCTADGRRYTSKGMVTGDFEKAYRMEADVTGAENGKTVSARQVVNARYSGACPVDMKPGDKRVVVNGQTLPIPAAEPAG